MASNYSSSSLQSLEKVLESTENLSELLLELSRKRILDKVGKERLGLLDQSLKHDILIRFVILMVNERAQDDGKVCDKICQFVKRYGYCPVEPTGNCRDQVLLGENDIQHLTEYLTPGSYKWEEIGIAVGLPKHIREDCGKGSSNVVRMTNVLTAWIMGGHTSHPASLKSLTDSLLSCTVQLAQLAHSLNQYIADTSVEPCKLPSKTSSVEITEEPLDTEVPEGISTLLEVQVSSAEPVSYQWLKDGKEISETSNYSGTSTPILYIGQCSQHSQGSYSCVIRSGIVELKSEAAELTVKMSVEKEHLLKCYSHIRPRDPWPPISNNAYHTLILHEKSKYNDEKCVPVTKTMEQLLVKKDTITYKEAFSVFCESSLVIIEGRPGSGKTTLVHNLVSDWANRESVLVGSKLVILVTLRIVQCNNTLEDLLKVFYSEVNTRRKLVEELEISNGKNMCFVLDGWDEYQYQGTDNIIVQLLHKTYLTSSMVIITSRPVALTTDLKCRSSVRIEVIGFTADRILEYVRSYPFQEICSNSNGMAINLITYLQTHVNVFHMCYLPLNASIICYLYAKNEGDIPCTETKIYEAFTIATILRKVKCDKKHCVQIKSLADLDSHYKEKFLQVCKLAFEMTINSSQTVSKESLSSQVLLIGDTNSDNFSLGLLTVQRMSLAYGEDQLCSFHHLSFQEFLAAYHLTKLSQDLQDSFITGKKNLKNVLKYYFGIKLFTGAVDQIIRELSTNYDNLDIIHFVFESQQSIVHSSFTELNRGVLTLHNVFLSPIDFVAIAYILSKSPCINKIQYSQCLYDVESLPMLDGKNFNHIKYLQIEGSCDSECIAGIINTFQNLEAIDVSTSNICHFVPELTAICAPHLRVVKINVCDPLHSTYDLVPKLNFGSKYLEQIYFRWTSLRHLKIMKAAINAHFGFECYSGKSCPSIYLCGQPEQLRYVALDKFAIFVEISLINCEIDDRLVCYLSQGFRKSTHLVTLELDYNKISDDGAIIIAECLMSLLNINSISLQCNSIGNPGAIAIAAVISQCSSLNHLDLQGNYISNEGALAIANAAAQLPSLQVYVCNVEVSEDVMEEIMKCTQNVNFEDNLLNASAWTSIEKSNCRCQAWGCGKSSAIELFSRDMELIDSYLTNLLHGVTTLKLILLYSRENFCKCLLYTANLKHLYLHGVSFPDSDISEDLFHALTNCKNLQSVSLISSPILESPWEILKCIKYLRKLDVVESITQASINDIYELCAGCTHLRELNLSCNDLTLSGSANNSLADIDVQTLDLSSNELTPCKDLINDLLQHCTNIVCLNLSHSLHQVSKIRHGLENITTLKELQLQNIGVNQEDCVYLSTVIGNNYNLRLINLESNKINSSGAFILAEAFKSAISLELLNLSHNPLTSEGVHCILNSLKCTNLNTLILEQVGLDEIGTTAFVDFECGKNLKELDLSYNCLNSTQNALHDEDTLSDELLLAISFGEYSLPAESYGFHYLADGMTFCHHLTSLNLAGTDMNQNGILLLVESMKVCYQLEYIDLSHNPLVDSRGLLTLVEGLQFDKLELDLTCSINSTCAKSLNHGEIKECCNICRDILRIYYSNDFLSVRIITFGSGYIPKLMALREVF